MKSVYDEQEYSAMNLWALPAHTTHKLTRKRKNWLFGTLHGGFTEMLIFHHGLVSTACSHYAQIALIFLVLWDFPWCGGSCHSERSEESRSVGNETLRCAQGDNAVGNFNTYHANSQRAFIFFRVNSRHSRLILAQPSEILKSRKN